MIKNRSTILVVAFSFLLMSGCITTSTDETQVMLYNRVKALETEVEALRQEMKAIKEPSKYKTYLELKEYFEGKEVEE